MMKTLSFAKCAGAMVVVHTEAAPEPNEWVTYVATLAAVLGANPCTPVLVITEGGGPDARQRAQLKDAVGAASGRVAICTHSGIARRMITAIGWITHGTLRGFDHDDLPAAMTFLDLAPARLGEIKAQIHKLQAAIGARPIRG